jgi:hypothetical protein
MAAASDVIGLYFSYYVNVASGSAIVLTATLLFILVWGINKVGSKWATKRSNYFALVEIPELLNSLQRIRYILYDSRVLFIRSSIIQD